jgi:epoxyqueuosine reductase
MTRQCAHVAELAAQRIGQRTHIVRACIDRMRWRTGLGPSVMAQIDEDDAPLASPLDDLASDAAPVRSGTVDSVREQEPALGRALAMRDAFVMEARHIATMPHSRSMGLDVNRVIAQLADAGLDLVHAFDAHALASISGWARLASGPRLGLLVGNTRALWPHFVAARDSLPARDPLDHYVERVIENVVTDGALYAHRSYDGAFLPFQHLAVAVGFGALTEGRLVVHPIYGPWFALRAVILIDGIDSELPVRTPIAKPCACTDACRKALDEALAEPDNGRAWLAVRDACSLRAWRYSDEQIRFHYANAWPADFGGPTS